MITHFTVSRFGALLAIGAALAFAPAAHAQTTAFDFLTARTSSDNHYTLGVRFTVNEAITVTDLGYFDDLGDGFAGSHTLGLFDGSGSLLTSVTLGPGASGTLDNKYRYASINPVALLVGNTYTVAGTTTSADAYAYGNDETGFTTTPAISLTAQSALYQEGATLTNPTRNFGYKFYGGANFKYATNTNANNAVPEPGSLALLLLPTAALLRRRAR